MSNIWTDTIERVGRGRKRHAYEATRQTKQDRDGGETCKRKCGTSDDGPGTHATATKSELQREDAKEYALDTNACLICVDALGLMPYRENNRPSSNGAASVNADPFGVFGGDNQFEDDDG